jgi:hypothetical protein
MNNEHTFPLLLTQKVMLGFANAPRSTVLAGVEVVNADTNNPTIGTKEA